ncbi:hypothetical protein VNO80_10848 [Phaseolus coccineus]|uniref:Uncharacterized protein n=1 Tax=Phaseolus coccineus TaxID=3886 RepID=A0AAN9NE54_PHACN
MHFYLYGYCNIRGGEMEERGGFVVGVRAVGNLAEYRLCVGLQRGELRRRLNWLQKYKGNLTQYGCVQWCRWKQNSAVFLSIKRALPSSLTSGAVVCCSLD